MHNFKYWLTSNKWLFGVLCLVISSWTHAIVNIDRTRIIINAGDNSASFNLMNEATDQPTLVQIWIDDGDPTLAPDKIKSPVIVLEPIFRIAAQEQRNIKLIVPNPQQLIKDRESVYWLNVLQIPARQAMQNNQQRVFLPLRIRLKLFIRPTQIAAPSVKDMHALQFTQQDNALIVNNPTPWNITLVGIQAGSLALNDVMVPAKSQHTFNLEHPIKEATPIQFSVINDAGTLWSMTTLLRPSAQ